MHSIKNYLPIWKPLVLGALVFLSLSFAILPYAGNTLPADPICTQDKTKIVFRGDILRVYTAGCLTEEPDKDPTMDVMLGFILHIKPKLTEFMAEQILANTPANLGAEYNCAMLEVPVSQWANNDKKVEKWKESCTKKGSVQYPPISDFNILFSDVHLEWDPKSEFYKMYNEPILSFLGDKPIHRRVKAYFELKNGAETSSFQLCIMAGPEEWYFFAYNHKILTICSSNEKFNKKVDGIDIEYRRVRGEPHEYYLYKYNDDSNMQKAFVEGMEKWISER